MPKKELGEPTARESVLGKSPFPELPVSGQRAFEIIIEDQRRRERSKRYPGVHSNDRPTLYFGRFLSVINLVSYFGNELKGTTIDESSKKQIVFESRIMKRLLSKVEPGKTVVVGGSAWYHYTEKRWSPDWDREEKSAPENNFDYHTPVDLTLEMDFSEDSRKVIVRFSTVPTKGSSRATLSLPSEDASNFGRIPGKTLVFKSCRTPDIRGALRERLRAVRH